MKLFRISHETGAVDEESFVRVERIITANRPKAYFDNCLEAYVEGESWDQDKIRAFRVRTNDFASYVFAEDGITSEQVRAAFRYLPRIIVDQIIRVGVTI